MVDFRTAQEFIEKTKNCESLDEIKSEFQKIIRGLGFSTFSCVSYVDFNAPPEGAVTIVEYPEAFFDRYKDQHYEEHDRILKIALKQYLPFVWTSEVVQKGMPKQAKAIFDDAASVDMLQGITVPIHKRGAYPGTVNVVGDNFDINPDSISLIHLMGIYLHDAALKFYEKEFREKEIIGEMLTDKERECLKWVAIGKTDWEIGEILCRSENTVHNHIENAKRKLGVSTRVQAVVQAYHLNQILP